MCVATFARVRFMRSAEKQQSWYVLRNRTLAALDVPRGKRLPWDKHARRMACWLLSRCSSADLASLAAGQEPAWLPGALEEVRADLPEGIKAAYSAALSRGEAQTACEERLAHGEQDQTAGFQSAANRFQK